MSLAKRAAEFSSVDFSPGNVTVGDVIAHGPARVGAAFERHYAQRAKDKPQVFRTTAAGAAGGALAGAAAGHLLGAAKGGAAVGLISGGLTGLHLGLKAKKGIQRARALQTLSPQQRRTAITHDIGRRVDRSLRHATDMPSKIYI